MPPETARATSPSQPRRSTCQRPRDERVAHVIDLEAARQARASTRAAAHAQGVAESTLRGWHLRAHDDELPDPVRRFFETPHGLRLLHRIVTAALVVIVLMGGNGVSLVRAFLVGSVKKSVSGSCGSGNKGEQEHGTRRAADEDRGEGERCGGARDDARLVVLDTG